MENIDNTKQELNAIIAALEEFPKGAQLREILAKSNLNISSRTSLRRIDFLEKNKVIISQKK